jgi:nitrite reductase/ring-hydroxylating ferredoxin subunit
VSPDRYETVARVDEIEPGTVRTVRAGDREIALARVGDEFYVTQQQCLHLQGPLGEGRLEDHVLTCPWHGWQYDVRTGENEFDRAIKLETYDVRVEDGEVKSEQLAAGLDLIRRGEFFAAHEELEDAWRAAEPEERDFFQGLVHFAVAWYQAGRGNRVGCERQLEKAARRLGLFEPKHRGVDVASLLAQVADAARVVERGSLELPAPRL